MRQSRHKNILDDQKSLLLVVDVQERFRPHIEHSEQLIKNITVLINGFNSLSLPVVVTEQYPRGLGQTVAEIKNLQKPSWKFFEKSTFSAATNADVIDCLKDFGRQQIVVCGIETHVCVNQTVHDLLDLGYQPHIVVDAVGSRSDLNKQTALTKMYSGGALATNVEMVLFELLIQADHPKFKEVQSLVK